LNSDIARCRPERGRAELPALDLSVRTNDRDTLDTSAAFPSDPGTLTYYSNFHAQADVEIPDPELPDVVNTVNARDTAKKAIEAGIYKLQFPAQSGFSRFGAVIAPWLIGERRQ
jgi:hypothetical protein